MTNIVNGINYDAFAENLNDKLDIDASNATQATENWVKSVGGADGVVGALIPVLASDTYVPNGCQPCDGKEYDASEYPEFWNDFCGKTEYVTKHYTKVGNIQETEEKVISGFSESNYVDLDRVFSPKPTDTWELFFKFETGPQVVTTQEQFLSSDGFGITFCIGGTQTIQPYISSNGTSWNISTDAQAGGSVAPGTIYYFKAIFDGNYIKAWLSQDKQTWNQCFSIQTTETVFPASIRLGIWGGSVHQPFSGKFYLNESYIKINKITWWIAETRGLSGGNAICCTYEDYQKDIEAYKSCARFGIDKVNNKFKVPTIRDGATLTQAMSDSELGRSYNESLPDAIYYSDAAWGTASGDANRSLVTSKGGYEVNNTGKGLLTGTAQNATPTYSYSYGKLSASNSTYQDNALVQTNNIRVRWFVRLANSIKESYNQIEKYQINSTFFYGMSHWYKGTMNNSSWLRSNGQWNSGNVYEGLWNWLIEKYNRPDFKTTFDNANLFGNILLIDHELKGFSLTNHATPKKLMDPTKPWELVVKFKTGSTVGGFSRVIGTMSEFDTHGIVVGFSNTGNLAIYLSSTGTSWDIANNAATGFNSLAINTTYWYKLAYNGSQYQSWYSTDGRSYTAGNIIANTKPIYIDSLSLGNHKYSASGSQPWVGSVDLTGCYIKSAGEIVWNGIYEENGQVIDTTTEADEYRFVIDTKLKEFKLPLKNGQEGIFADGVKGNGISIGLLCKDGTNHALGGHSTAADNGYSYTVVTQLAKYNTTAGTAMGNTAASAANTTFGLTKDPDKSGMIVDKSIPEGWNLYWYVGDTLRNPQIIDIARISESVSMKVDKTQATEVSFPSDQRIDLTLGASGSTYTAPANGWFSLRGPVSAQGYIGSNLVGLTSVGSSSFGFNAYVPVKTGDVVTISYSKVDSFQFIYAKGSSTE